MIAIGNCQLGELASSGTILSRNIQLNSAQLFVPSHNLARGESASKKASREARRVLLEIGRHRSLSHARTALLIRRDAQLAIGAHFGAYDVHAHGLPRLHGPRGGPLRQTISGDPRSDLRSAGHAISWPSHVAHRADQSYLLHSLCGGARCDFH
eukprot:SAG11_NODE_505_length_8888_cov_12.479235_3_plen_154_part_00